MVYTRAQLDEKYEELPADIQESLYSDEVVICLKEIEKKYNLQREQTKNLSAEIGIIMFGVSSPQNFIPNIQKSMGIPEDVAKAIASEVNEKIFHPVKESLKTIYSLNKKEEPKKINIPVPIKKIDIETKHIPIEGSVSVKKEETKVIDPYREAI